MCSYARPSPPDLGRIGPARRARTSASDTSHRRDHPCADLGARDYSMPGATSPPQPSVRQRIVVEKAVADEPRPSGHLRPGPHRRDLLRGAALPARSACGSTRRRARTPRFRPSPAWSATCSNEQGLVGLTLPPSFPQQPWLYAYATRKVNGVAQDQDLAHQDGWRSREGDAAAPERAEGGHSPTTADGCSSSRQACSTWSSGGRQQIQLAQLSQQRQGAPDDADGRHPERQPLPGVADLLLRASQQLRARVRSEDARPVGDGERARVQR